MATPTRFPVGLNTFPPRHILNTYPVSPSPRQVAVQEDFLPYRAGDYTITTAVAGTVTTFPQLTGAVKLATSANATDTIYAFRLGAGFQLMPLNQAWYNTRFAYPRSVLNTNDTNIYLGGWFDAATLSASNNGIYFFKPSGGTAVNLIIKKAGTTTTFQNIADVSLPSGLFGDTNAVNGTLTATIAGNAFTAVSVATAGAGYQTSPLVLTTTTAGGTTGSTPVIVGLGSTGLSSTNPQVPIQSTQLPYGSLYAPYIATPGSGFTNGGPLTTLLEVEPVLDLSFYYNGKDTLYVGVNGRVVMTIGPAGQTAFAAGATINVATAAGGPSFAPTTQLTTSIAPVQPTAGSAYNILPTTLLNTGFGVANTSANIRTMYELEYYSAVELN